MTICSVTDQFISVPGGQVFVRRWNPLKSNGLAPVVLLHDSLGCVGLWRSFPEQLANILGRDVIAYDRLGFGQSSPRSELPSVDFLKEEASIYFPIIRDALELSEYMILGHSVGGPMALLIAAADENCNCAITLAGMVFLEEHSLDGIRAAKKFFAEQSEFNRLARWHQDKTQWVISAWTDTWLSPEFSDWSITADIESIKYPVLAIHGELDEFGSKAFPEKIVAHVGGLSSMKIIEGCGHVLHREKEADVLESISCFLTHVEN